MKFKKAMGLVLSLCIFLSGNTVHVFAMNELQEAADTQLVTEAENPTDSNAQDTETALEEVEDNVQASEAAESENAAQAIEPTESENTKTTKPADVEVQMEQPASISSAQADARDTSLADTDETYLLYDTNDFGSILGGYNTLEEAFEAVNLDDTGTAAFTIVVQNNDVDMYNSASLTTDKTVTLTSAKDNNFILKKTAKGRHVLITDGELILNNITLDGGGYSGGVSVNQGALTLQTGGIIQNNVSDGSGVGVSVIDGTFTMYDGAEICNNKNTAGNGVSGGGLRLNTSNYNDPDTGSTAYLYGGEIHDNQNTWAGGVSVGTNCTLVMDGGAIYNNAAGSQAGAGGVHVYVRGTFTMNGGSIHHNTSSSSGGGVYVGEASHVDGEPEDWARFVMNGGEISNNVTSSSGGGVVVTYNGGMEMNGGVISGNEAISKVNSAGGGIFLTGASAYGNGVSLIINDGTITDNKAKLGGGICVYEGTSYAGASATFRMRGGELSDNEATAAYGGGIFIQGTNTNRLTSEIGDSTGASTTAPVIKGNKAASQGGGIMLYNTKLTMYDGEIYGNTAGSLGGGVCVYESSSFTMKDGTIGSEDSQQGNSSDTSGGGIATFDGGNILTIDGGSVIGNTAKSTGYGGGGIYVGSGDTAILKDATVRGNSAAVKGGGVYVSNTGKLTVDSGTAFTDNTAGQDGGGIFSTQYMYGSNGEYWGTQKGFYANLIIAGDTVFRVNTASGAYNPPLDAAELTNLGYATTSLTDNGEYVHPLNNYDINYVRKSALALYAVKYDANNGSGASHTETEIVGNAHTVLPNSNANLGFTYSGHTFKGWSTEQGSQVVNYEGKGDEQIGEEAQANDELVLYAVWQENKVDPEPTPTYTVVYHANNATDASYSKTEDVGSTHTVLSNSDVNLGFTYSGYTFKGWSTEQGSLVVNYEGKGDEQIGANAQANDELVLYAVWQKNKVDPEPTPIYTVVYHANNATDASYSKTENVGNTHTVLSNSDANLGFTYSGYTFKGWSTEQGSTAATYAGTGTEILADSNQLTQDSRVDLYAVWKKNTTGGGGGGSTTYTVTYNAGGGTGSHSDGGLSSGATYTVKSQSATGIARANFTFTGWNTKADGTGTTYAAADTFKISGNVTLYAQWKAADDDSLLNREDHMAYVIGYTDGTVKPTANISRAETATIYFRLLTEAARNSYWTTTNDYSDVSAENWFHNAVSTMSSAGIITGYTDGTFGGNRNITRAEFAAIAARFDSGAYTGNDKFSDISGHWAAEYINRAAEKGWITGYEDGSFKPNQYITRAEAMTLINRVLERDNIASMHADMKTWSDNPATAWYYEAVQEATNSHEYTRDASTNAESWTAVTIAPDWAVLEKSWSTANSI